MSKSYQVGIVSPCVMFMCFSLIIRFTGWELTIRPLLVDALPRIFTVISFLGCAVLVAEGSTPDPSSSFQFLLLRNTLTFPPGASSASLHVGISPLNLLQPRLRLQ